VSAREWLRESWCLLPVAAVALIGSALIEFMPESLAELHWLKMARGVEP